MKKISLIIPVFNEAGNLQPLVKAIDELPLQSYEIIFINDGSTDISQQELVRLQQQYSRIKIIQFVRNFGQTAAWAAGFDHAQGDILITLDADLQNDPADIPQMLNIMKEKKAEIVTGYRENRKDPLLRSMFSKVANKLINWIMGSDIKDAGCSLRLIKKSALDGITLYGEMHRLLPFLLSGYGAIIVQTPVNHHPRTHGQSKYGFSRTFKVLFDVMTVKFLTSYQTKPIYMFGFFGMLQIGLSFIIGVFVVIRALFFAGDWISPLFAIGVIFFAYGIIAIFMGLLAEIQIRTWYESSGKKNYVIKKIG